MALTPIHFLWESKYPSLRESMDRIFEDFFSHGGLPSLVGGTWLPAVDVHETKNDLIVTLDAPSVDPEKISILISDGRLVIKGERKKEEELEEKDVFRSERFFGSFQRMIQLPVEVVTDKARATYKDGVLKIVMPKSQKKIPKEIKIEVK